MLNYIWYICLELGVIVIATYEVAGDKIRKSKYARAYSFLLPSLCVVSLVFYFASIFFANGASVGLQLSSLFLWVYPIIYLIVRGSERGSLKHITCNWVLIFVSIIAIAVRLFGY